MSTNRIRVLSLYLAVFLYMVSIASGELTITSIRVSPEAIESEQAFSIIVTLSGENTCDAVVRVPNDLFTACFEFETPYPGKQKKAGKAAQKSGPNDEWGKVIPFPSKGKNVVPFQPKKK